MAEVTAALVKKLREMTGAGMMDCKKALVATEGNIDAAVDFLREKGLAAAQKKASRIAAEGLVKAIVEDNKKAVIVEVNSETDFVAKNEKFQNYVGQVAEQALNTTAADLDAFLAEPWALDTTKTVAEELSSKVFEIGEKLSIRRFTQMNGTEGPVVSYIHGGRIGVLVEGKCAACSDEVLEALKNIAMQIASMNPQYVSKNDVSAEELEKLRHITIESALNTPDTLPRPILNGLIDRAVNEKVWSDEDIAIYKEQKNNFNNLFNFLSKESKTQLAGLAMEQKDEIAANKIFLGLVEGRFAKQLKDICLNEQIYVKAEDGKQSVAQYLQQVSKAVGTELTVKSFVRYEVGEGMEKREDNFAEEVAKQAGLV